MGPGQGTLPRSPGREGRGLPVILRWAFLLGTLVAAGGGEACRPAPPPPPRTPTATPTASPAPVVPTATVSLPPTMGLVGKVDHEIARALTAAVPRTPTRVMESRAEQADISAPATPPPTTVR